MEAQPSEAQKRMVAFLPFAFLLMFFLLVFLIFFISSRTDGWSNSIDLQAFLQAEFFYPFTLLVVLNAAFALWFSGHISRPGTRFPQASRKTLPFALSTFPSLMGFALSFVNQNTYLIAPYLALSLAMWVYFYSRMDK